MKNMLLFSAVYIAIGCSAANNDATAQPQEKIKAEKPTVEKEKPEAETEKPVGLTRKSSAPETQADIDASLIQFLKDIHEKFATGTDQETKQAVDAYMVKKSDVEILFPKHVHQIWSVLGPARERYLKNHDKIAAEFKRKGVIKEIEVINVRLNDTSGLFQRVLPMIPKDVPVYRAIVRGDKGSGGSSSYLRIKGRWFWFGGLEVMPRFIKEKEKEAAPGGPAESRQ